MHDPRQQNKIKVHVLLVLVRVGEPVRAREQLQSEHTARERAAQPHDRVHARDRAACSHAASVPAITPPDTPAVQSHVGITQL